MVNKWSHGERFVGTSAAARELQRSVEAYAPTPYPILLLGETGSGKELVAQEMHRLSGRNEFVVVDCTILQSDLLGSELFGHERGAFTGAQSPRKGLLEVAANGTVFFDEIGELPLKMQASLLRFLQTREFRRIGSNLYRQSECRVIAATNRDLRAEVEAGRFRADLLERLSVLEIHVPPLRERLQDLKGLITHIQRTHKLDINFSTDAMAMIMCYQWPGNIRELENLLIKLHVLRKGALIEPADLGGRFFTDSAGAGRNRRHVIDPLEPTSTQETEGPKKSLSSMTMCELETFHILNTLEASNGSLSEVAKRLQIGKSTVYRKLKAIQDAQVQSFAATG